jgi:hypothetical protein
MVTPLIFTSLAAPFIALAAFFLIVWPGYSILHMLGYGRHRWSAAMFAGPTVTLALWIISLSGAAWASIPLRMLFPPVWVGTLLLAALGIALRSSVNRQVTAVSANTRWERLLLWSTAGFVPLVIMPATLRYGLGDFVNSTSPDVWSYVMVADYLSELARGAEGGLSVLHQYAAHLMNTRNASSAILGHLAFGLGDVKADQAITLYCLLLLFANTSALIAFALTAFERIGPALCLGTLAGLGWPADIVFAGNFDQLLLLPLLPLIAAFALQAGRGINLWSTSVLVGVVSAAAFFAYVELAFFGLVVAMTFVIPPNIRFRLAAIRVALICCIAIPIFLLLTWPGFATLMTSLKNQYLSTAGTVRPSEGAFPGLLWLRLSPDTVWAFGGELLARRGLALSWILGAIFCATSLLGVWVERRYWSIVLGLATVLAAFLYFVIHEHYSYGAYKIISVNFWMFCFFTVVGGVWLLERSKSLTWLPVPAKALVAAALFAAGLDRTVLQVKLVKFEHNALQQETYRETAAIADIVRHEPTLLAVRDDVANEWAVFHLSDMPLLVSPYRIYMAQAHVIPFMERAKAIEPSAIRYIVTDRNDTIRAPVTGAQRIWDGQAYSLWRIDSKAWAVLADVRNPSGLEADGISLGGGKFEFVIVAGQSGRATLTSHVQPDPQSLSRTTLFHFMLEDGAGTHNIDVHVDDDIRLRVDLVAGRAVISVTANEPVSGNTNANGESRPTTLRLINYGIERSDDLAR